MNRVEFVENEIRESVKENDMFNRYDIIENVNGVFFTIECKGGEVYESDNVPRLLFDILASMFVEGVWIHWDEKKIVFKINKEE